MPTVKKRHFERAAADIGANGDNDTLPFDMDNRFIKAKAADLVDLACSFSRKFERCDKTAARDYIESASMFSERLLAPAGPSGFRVVTKIHPFWNIYFNGLAIAIAEASEPHRSSRVHSYRFQNEGEELFQPDASWRAFRLAALNDSQGAGVVVQTDISSFYERVYHHRLENLIDDLFPDDHNVAVQIDRILSRLAAGRSFGLPVGGQGSRILAELLLSQVDQQLDELGIKWRRYVDDFVLVASSPAEGYRWLSILSNLLADYGLSLNRSKTTVLSCKHFRDYVDAQMGAESDDARKLMEIDLHFDPYSDQPEEDFEQLRGVVDSLDIARLLDLERSKSQPDTFLVSQITRTLRLQKPELALQLCQTLLSPSNLHAFRASWSTLMRGISSVRADPNFSEIFAGLDLLLDRVPEHSSHLLMAETSTLHFLRAIRFRRSSARAKIVRTLYADTQSKTVRRACIDCWRQWKDRASFTSLRNQWDALSAEEQRMLFLSSAEFGDAGEKFRRQVTARAKQSWKLGFEKSGKATFAGIFLEWDGQ